MNIKSEYLYNYLLNPTLRILTCGSVDDGKSTFLARLLLDSGNTYKDHLDSLKTTSRKFFTAGDQPQLAFLIDGLKAEVEQGITIDVSYRYFFTPKRKFIVADAPGHDQYTRNMAVAASKSDAAVVLIDATAGIKPQTVRHLSILSLLRVDRLIICVNKMDLASFSRDRFEKIKSEAIRTVKHVYDHECSFSFVPICAKDGDNVAADSNTMPWYEGGCVLHLLESVDTGGMRSSEFCLPVQYVARESDRRFYAGTIVSGSISVNDEILVLPSSTRTRVGSIAAAGISSDTAERGDAVMLGLTDEIDISRGDKIVKSGKNFKRGDLLSCRVFWFGENAMAARDIYELKFLSRKVRSTVKSVDERLDLASLDRRPAARLEQNEIGFVTVALASTLFCLPFRESKELGSFLVVDIGTGDTVGLCTIESVGNTTHTYPYETMTDKSMRAILKNQHPMLIWFTGLSGSGKSTIANLLERRLYERGYHTYLLDGDILRNGLNSDLGFDQSSRKENIRRAGEVAKLMVDAGLVVMSSFISPFMEDRAFVRSLFQEGEFCEVFVSAPLEECIRRDPKGLYAKAMRGEISDFTGISSPYEEPVDPEITLDTSKIRPYEAVEIILNHIMED